jgi:TonB family protein
MRLIPLVLALSFALMAQETDPAHVYRIGGGVSPPSLVKKVEPQYSDEAHKAHLEGTVALGVIIGSDGKARDFKILRSLGLGLDEKAIAAVSAWEFGPSTKDGQPVNVQAQIEMTFRMLDRDSKPGWHLDRAEFHLLEGLRRPIVEDVISPRVADDAGHATATVTFDIDEKGAPTNVRIERASDGEWSAAVTAALSRWKFQAASSQGSPVSVPCTMDFVRGN